jgi:thioredoxin-like negative regulator of GroEL
VKNINQQQLEQLKQKGESFYIYISAPNCGVCEVLKPKLEAFMKRNFPLLDAFQSNSGVDASLAAQLGLFTNPSFVAFIAGQEVVRRSRSIGLDELDVSLGRYYQMYFE